MEIKNCIYKTKCDLGGCKNLATYSVMSAEGKSVLNLCDSCSNQLYGTLGKVKTPKSIPAPFKKQKKIELEVK